MPDRLLSANDVVVELQTSFQNHKVLRHYHRFPSARNGLRFIQLPSNVCCFLMRFPFQTVLHLLFFKIKCVE